MAVRGQALPSRQPSHTARTVCAGQRSHLYSVRMGTRLSLSLTESPGGALSGEEQQPESVRTSLSGLRSQRQRPPESLLVERVILTFEGRLFTAWSRHLQTAPVFPQVHLVSQLGLDSGCSGELKSEARAMELAARHEPFSAH